VHSPWLSIHLHEWIRICSTNRNGTWQHLHVYRYRAFWSPLLDRPSNWIWEHCSLSQTGIVRSTSEYDSPREFEFSRSEGEGHNRKRAGLTLAEPRRGFADLSGIAKGSARSNLVVLVKPLFIPSKVLVAPMFAPGIISIAFYKRRPTRGQVILGLVATVVLSALLGYISPGGSIGQLGSVILAVVGGVILYVVILAVLLYWYQPRHAKPPMPTPPAPAP
jgi:uncharacterized membrane protein YeaQ/YmgE (transglycosylase-associated protein family)